MPGDVVGTAYVTIRALTAGIAKDIEDGVKKGAADADVDARWPGGRQQVLQGLR